MLSFYLAVIQDEKSKSKFENIYLTHHKTMLKIAFEITKNQHDAEDALSDALYKIARNIEKIDDTNEILLKSYLFKATKNSAIDILRKRSKEVNPEAVFTLPSESDVISEIVGDEEYRMLIKSIYTMPYTYRDVLVHQRSIKRTFLFQRRLCRYDLVPNTRHRKSDSPITVSRFFRCF